MNNIPKTMARGHWGARSNPAASVALAYGRPWLLYYNAFNNLFCICHVNRTVSGLAVARQSRIRPSGQNV